MRKLLTFNELPTPADQDNAVKLSEYFDELDATIYDENDRECHFNFQEKLQEYKANQASIITLLFYTFAHLKRLADGGEYVNPLKNKCFCPGYNFVSGDSNIILTAVEGFMKGILKILYEEKYDRTTDATVFNLLLNGVNSKGEKLSSSNGKQGIVNPDDGQFIKLGHTIRHFRNANVHWVDKNKYPEKDIYLDKRNRRTGIISDNVCFFIMLVIMYLYDEIYDIVIPAIPEGIKVSHEQKDDKETAQEVLVTKYIPHLEKQQVDNLRRSYSMYGYSDDMEIPDMVHVKLKAYRPEDDKEENEEDQEEITTDPLAIIGDPLNKKVFFGGGSGTGKSTMLSQMIMKAIEHWRDPSEGHIKYLPVRINLAKYTEPGTSLQTYINDSVVRGQNYSLCIDETNAVTKYIQELCSEGRLIIFLDGLNEIPRNIPDVISNIIEHGREYPGCQYVVTSRILEIRNQLSMLESFNMYELCPLSRNQVKEQMKNYARMKRREDKQEEMWNEIMGTANLESFSTNPMQLMLLLELIQNNGNKDLSSLNTTSLYDLFIDEILTRENNTNAKSGKDQERGIERRDFDRILMNLSDLMLESNTRTVSRYTFEDVLCSKNIFGGNLFICRSILDFAGISGLISMEEETISFTHDSWMEFYQALHIMSEFSRLFQSEVSEEEATSGKQAIAGLFGDKLEQHILLRNTYELMEQRHVNSAVQCEFTILLLQKGWVDEELDFCLEGQNGCYHPDKGRFPVPNRFLPVLSWAASSTTYKEPGDKDRNSDLHKCYRLNPKYLVESFILNQLYLYKRTYPDGEENISIDVLKPLFICASLSGSEKVLDELFKPYWLRLWILRQEDFRLFFNYTQEELEHPERLSPTKRTAMPGEIRLLSSCIMKNSTNVFALFRRLYAAQLTINGMHMTKTYLEIQRDIVTLLLKISRKELDRIQAYLDQMPASNTRTQYRYFVMICMENYSGIISNINEYHNIQLPTQFINKLLADANDEDALAILLELVSQNKLGTNSIRVIRYLLLGNIHPREIGEFLWENEERKKLQKEIADNLPLKTIPADYVHKNYDLDIYRYQLSNLADDEEAVKYFVYDCTEDGIRIAVQDISFDFKGFFVKVRSGADESMIVGKVKDESYEYQYRYTVKIACENARQLLPLVGKLEGELPDGTICSKNYLAAASNSEGLTLYIYDKIWASRFQGWMNAGASVHIDGVDCRIEAVSRASLQTQLRILDLEISGIPKFRGVLWIYETEKCLRLQQVNKSIRTPFNRRGELFRPIVLDEYDKGGSITRKDLHYAIFSQRTTQSLVLATEKVKTNLLGRYCRVSGCNQWFIVDDISDFPAEFLEITLAGSASGIPGNGIVRLGRNLPGEGENDWNMIPYVYCIHRGVNFIMRIEDPLWIEKLKDPEIQAYLQENSSVTVRKQHLEFISVNVYEHSPSSSRIAVHAISGKTDDDTIAEFAEDLPAEGEMTFYNVKKKNQTQILLTVRNMTRNKIRNVKNIVCAGKDGEKVNFICQSDADLREGCYLHLDNHPATYRINTMYPLGKMLDLGFCTEADIPESGIVFFDIMPDAGVRYFRNKGKEKDGYIRMTLLPYAETTQDRIGDMDCTSIRQFTVDSASYSVDGVEVSDTEAYKLFFSLDVPDGEDDIQEFYQSGKLQYYQPVDNSTEADIFETIAGQMYEVSRISYIYASYNGCQVLLIPETVTDISGLHYCINGKNEYHRVRTCNLPQDFVSSLCNFPMYALQIPPMIDFIPQLESEGYLEFFYDDMGRNPAKLGYKYLMPMIEFNKPEKYHTSVCELLLDELKELNTAGNMNFYNFFMQKSYSAEYLEYYLCQSEEWQRRHGMISPDIAIVLGTNSAGVSLFDPKKAGMMEHGSFNSKKGLILMEDVSKDLKKGELVIYEKNHKVTKLKTKLRNRMIGYLRGVVVKENNGTDYFIKVQDWFEDFYYHKEKDIQTELHEGDQVSFYPSMNISTKSYGKPLADKVMKTGCLISEGTVSGISWTNDKKLKIKVVEITDDRTHQVCRAYVVYSKDLPEKIRARYDALKTDDKVNYYLQSGEDMPRRGVNANILF